MKKIISFYYSTVFVKLPRQTFPLVFSVGTVALATLQLKSDAEMYKWTILHRFELFIQTISIFEEKKTYITYIQNESI